jgi:F0F1-type ATP synthase assembly protein I
LSSPIGKLGSYYDLVIRFPVTVMAPALLGWWADGKLGTGHWLVVIGFHLGLAAAFYTLYRTFKVKKKKNEE